MLNKTTYRELKAKIIIKECDEKLLEIPSTFTRFTPHLYQKLDAPYGDKSPFFLREEVIVRLEKAQKRLQTLQRGYRLKIFDAYRPLSVQRFMIEYDTQRIAREKYGSSFELLTLSEQDKVQKVVSHFWSPISNDVDLNPPPHSTGGALDLTIVDGAGVVLDMGTEIDELVDASESDYYLNSNTGYQKNRELLVEVMLYAGFVQLPTEWWHFSYGDQIWALDKGRVDAIYGLVN
jgi:D-alanyl-D-alanine dipeptidase